MLMLGEYGLGETKLRGDWVEMKENEEKKDASEGSAPHSNTRCSFHAKTALKTQHVSSVTIII